MHFDKVDWLIQFFNQLYACWFLLGAMIANSWTANNQGILL